MPSSMTDDFEKAQGNILDYQLIIYRPLDSLAYMNKNKCFYQLENLLKDCKIDSIHPLEANRLISDLIYTMDEFFKIATIFAKIKQKAKQRSFNRISMRLKRYESCKISHALISEGERFSFFTKDTQRLPQGNVSY